MTELTGLEKARAKANEIRGEVNKVKEEVKKEEEAKVALMNMQVDPELVKMYKDNAEVGSENLGGALPLLRVHSNRSTSNKLADGTNPNEGWFFYKPTKQQFETVTCHILTVGKGFRKEGLQAGKEVFNQLMAGVIIDGKELKPFIMYVNGKKLNGLWDFGKEASQYTKAKPVGIPLFALFVKISTRQVKTDFGPAYELVFEIEKTEGGFPRVVTDVGECVFLRDMVEGVTDTMASIVSAKIDEEEDVVQKAKEAGLVGEEVKESTPF
jgi:hypothetical protein